VAVLRKVTGGGGQDGVSCVDEEGAEMLRDADSCLMDEVMSFTTWAVFMVFMFGLTMTEVDG
jgi:hypothetical protein